MSGIPRRLLWSLLDTGITSYRHGPHPSPNMQDTTKQARASCFQYITAERSRTKGATAWQPRSASLSTGLPTFDPLPSGPWLSLPGPLQFLWSPSFPSLEQIQWVQMAQMYERLCHLICRTSLSYMRSYWAPERQLIRREDEWLKKSWELTWSLGHFGVDLEGLRHIATAHMKHYKI